MNIPEPELEAMIDIETLDTRKSAVVFQVALALFTREEIRQCYTWSIGIDEQLAAGRTISSDTLAFHLEKEGTIANLKHCLEYNPVNISSFRSELRRAISNNVTSIWTKGSFDLPVLESLLEGREIPWTFRQPRELRTLMKECGVARGEVAHNAMDDCLAQIKQLGECRQILAAGRRTDG